MTSREATRTLPLPRLEASDSLMSDETTHESAPQGRIAFVPGAALSTLSFEYDEIPLERLGDDEPGPGDLPPAR